MLKVKIEGLDRVQKKCQSIAGKARRAAVEAMTKTAQEIRSAERSRMQQAFDRPTPWVMKSVLVKKATKDRPEAKVWIDDEPGGKGTPPDRILQAEINGGARRQKRSEKALQRIGVLPSGWVAVPTRHAKKDGYGNMDRGQLVQILSALEAFGEQGYKANSTIRSRKARWKGNAKKGIRGHEYFAMGPGSKGLPPGIYMRKNYSSDERQKVAHLRRDGAKPIMIFAPKASYTVRLRFFDIAQEVIDRDLNRNFNETLRKYMQADGLL